jgi:hypothetical protein
MGKAQKGLFVTSISNTTPRRVAIQLYLKESAMPPRNAPTVCTLAIFGIILGVLPTGSAAQARPNILIIVADDLGFSDVDFQPNNCSVSKVRTTQTPALSLPFPDSTQIQIPSLSLSFFLL